MKYGHLLLKKGLNEVLLLGLLIIGVLLVRVILPRFGGCVDAFVSLFGRHHFGSKMAGVTTSRVVAHEPITMEFRTLPSLHPGLKELGKVQPIEQVQQKTSPKTKMKMIKQQFKDVFPIQKNVMVHFHVNLLEGRKKGKRCDFLLQASSLSLVKLSHCIWEDGDLEHGHVGLQ